MKRRQWLLLGAMTVLTACADTGPRRGPGRDDGGWGGRPGRPGGPDYQGGPGGPGGPGRPGVGFGPGFVRGGVLRITGTVGYHQRIMLPPTSVMVVRVFDMTHGEQAANMIGERFIPVERRAPPLPFQLDIDSRRILEPQLAQLVIMAELIVEGRTRFASARYPVLTGRAGTHVDMVLMPVSQPVD
ncbi:MAG: YbaY family lipoprotein [Burkholderiaceae bacterium]